MDLFGLSRTTSLGGKSYAFVIVDDFSRYKWVLFLAHKNDVFHEFSKLCRKIQNEKGFTILHENNLSNYFWAEAVNTSCYILNRVLIRSSLDKTPYEL